ncbi:hypothetical protein, partial [Streptomyces griseofuscus]|uniref:hypothetical protein n=1 Tax=Streptomyces griseofuscus TaxID=146922 RepID=UPI003452E62E
VRLDGSWCNQDVLVTWAVRLDGSWCNQDVLVTWAVRLDGSWCNQDVLVTGDLTVPVLAAGQIAARHSRFPQYTG